MKETFVPVLLSCDIQNTFMCLQSLYDFIHCKSSWFIKHNYWAILKEKVSSLIYMSGSDENAMKKVCDLNNKGFFDIVDTSKNKTFSRLFTSFWINKLKTQQKKTNTIITPKIQPKYHIEKIISPITHSINMFVKTEKIAKTLHDGDTIIDECYDICRIKLNDKFQTIGHYKKDGSCDLCSPYPTFGVVLRLHSSELKKFKNYYYSWYWRKIDDHDDTIRKGDIVVNNVGDIVVNNGKDMHIVEDSKSVKNFNYVLRFGYFKPDIYENINKEIKQNFNNLLDVDKKRLFEHYLISKEKIYCTNSMYVSQIQKLVYKDSLKMSILYDHLASVIHYHIPREERIKLNNSLQKQLYISTEIEELYCYYYGILKKKEEMNFREIEIKKLRERISQLENKFALRNVKTR